MLNDFESFMIVYKAWRTLTKVMTKEQVQHCDETYEIFESCKLPGFLVKDDGEICDVNSAMLTESSLDKDLVKNLIGKNLLIYIKREIDGEKINSIEDLKCND